MTRLGQWMGAIALVGLAAGGATAQERKLIPPIRGEAPLDITKPATRVVGNEVITTFVVRNPATTGAIAGLKVEENWYDKGGNPVGGGIYRHARPLMPDEVIRVELKTPKSPKMNTNQYQFTHANGTVKVTTVAKLDAPKPPPTTK